MPYRKADSVWCCFWRKYLFLGVVWPYLHIQALCMIIQCFLLSVCHGARQLVSYRISYSPREKQRLGKLGAWDKLPWRKEGATSLIEKIDSSPVYIDLISDDSNSGNSKEKDSCLQKSADALYHCILMLFFVHLHSHCCPSGISLVFFSLISLSTT